MRFLLLAMALVLAVSPARADQYKLATFGFPPYEYEVDGVAQGIAVDLVRRVMRNLGHEVDIQVLPWARALAEAESGEVAAVFTAYKTPERERYLDYSREVLIDQTVSLFVRAGSPVDFSGRLPDLAGATIGVVNAMSYGPSFDAAAKTGVLKYLERTSDSRTNFRQLVSQRVDLVVSNRCVALDLLNEMQATTAVRELALPVESVSSYIAFTKATDMGGLRDAFDRELRAIKADGTYDRAVADRCTPTVTPVAPMAVAMADRTDAAMSPLPAACATGGPDRCQAWSAPP